MKYMSVKMNEIYMCKYEWNMCVLIWMKYVCVFVMKYMCVNMNEICVCICDEIYVYLWWNMGVCICDEIYVCKYEWNMCV